MLFRSSMDTSVLPKIWKQASVVPVYKKGGRQKPGNYRPISLTSIACRVLEALIRDQIMDHLTRHNLLTPAQHGFRPQRSCDSQLLETLNDWTKCIEDGNPQSWPDLGAGRTWQLARGAVSQLAAEPVLYGRLSLVEQGPGGL